MPWGSPPMPAELDSAQALGSSRAWCVLSVLWLALGSGAHSMLRQSHHHLRNRRVPVLMANGTLLILRMNE